jgi:hypothetical protein
MIDDDLDAELGLLSLETGRSKSELIRSFVREHVKPLPPLEEDPIWRLAGDCDFEPASIDDVVYGGAQ